MIEQAVQFISINFEMFILIVAGWCLLFLAVATFVKLDDITASGIRRFGQLFVYYFVMIGQVALMMIAGYIYWVNYEYKNPHILAERILPDTRWVKGSFKFYFIEDNQLKTIRTNGKNRKTILEVDEVVRSYQFSPDGKYITVITDRALYLYDRKSDNYEIIEAADDAPDGPVIEVLIRGLSWSPDSQQFAYETNKWSKIASVIAYKVYNLKTEKIRPIKETLRTIPFIYWNAAGDKMIFVNYEAMDTEFYQNRFEHRVFEIPLDTLKPKSVARIPSQSAKIDFPALSSRGIKLFDPLQRLSFSRTVTKKHSWVSSTGSKLGIDHDDFLYYIKNKWWRKRLFKIPRKKLEGDFERHQFKGGAYRISNVRWIPGGRYVLMNHSDKGILIMEPATGRVGQVSAEDGRAFGWFDIMEEN